MTSARGQGEIAQMRRSSAGASSCCIAGWEPLLMAKNFSQRNHARARVPGGEEMRAVVLSEPWPSHFTGPEAVGGQDLLQDARSVGHDAIDVHRDDATHLVRIINGPHV